MSAADPSGRPPEEASHRDALQQASRKANLFTASGGEGEIVTKLTVSVLVKRLFRALLMWAVLIALLLSAWGWNRISWVFARFELGLMMALLVWLWMESRIRDEEKLLLEEFGKEYASYRQRTAKLVPLVY